MRRNALGVRSNMRRAMFRTKTNHCSVVGMEKAHALRQPSPLMSGRLQQVLTRPMKSGRKQVNRAAVPPRGAFSAQMLRPPSTPTFSLDSPQKHPMRPEDDADISSETYEYDYAVISPRRKGSQSENQMLSPPPPPPPYHVNRRPKVMKTALPRMRSESIENRIKGQAALSPRVAAKSKQTSPQAQSSGSNNNSDQQTKQTAAKPTPSVHPIDTLSKKLRQQAMELTHVYEELEKQNLQLDAYKQQIKDQKRQLEQLRALKRKSIENVPTTSRAGALEQQRRAAQMMIGTPSTGASLGQKRGELDRKLKEAQQEKKKYELAAKRIENALVELQVFQNDRMENLLSTGTLNQGEEITSDDLETVLNEQRAYIRVLEEAVHLKATDFEVTGHEELLVVLAELRHTIYEQEKDLEEKSKVLESVQEQLQQEQQLHESTKGLLATLQCQQKDSTKRFHEQDSTMHTQLDEMRRQLQQREEQIRQCRSVSTDVQRKEEALQSRLEASVKTHNLTEAKLEDAMRSVRTLQDQLYTVSSQLEEARQQSTALKEECSRKQSHLDEMNALQEELLGSVDEYAGKAKKGNDKVERLEAELQACQQRETHAQNQSVEAARLLEEQIATLRTKIDAAERREQQVQAKCTSLQQEKDSLESSLVEVQQNLEEQIQDGSTQQLIIAAKENKCRQVEEAVAELESAFGAALCMMTGKQEEMFEARSSEGQDIVNEDGKDMDEHAFLLDPSVLRELQVCCQALSTLVTDQAPPPCTSLCPSFSEIITRITAIGERVQTEINRALASWSRERSNLVEACAMLDSTAQLCQNEMGKRHSEILDYRCQLMERTSEVEVYATQVDALDEQLRSAEAELEAYHVLQQHASNQEALLIAKQALIQDLSAENERLSQVESAYTVQVSTNARQSQRIEDQQEAMNEQQHYADELDRALESAATFAEQQNECNHQLNTKLTELESSRREQGDLIKTLKVQSSALSHRFEALVKQYIAFQRPIAATDRDLRDSLNIFEAKVQTGDTLALLEVFPALVDEYISTCGGGDPDEELGETQRNQARKRNPIGTTKQRELKTVKTPPSLVKNVAGRSLTTETEEAQLAEQLELIRDAFQSYRDV